jgi:hypothetical protein
MKTKIIEMKLSREEIEYIYYDLICFKSEWLLDNEYSRSEMLISLMDKFEKELENEEL